MKKYLLFFTLFSMVILLSLNNNATATCVAPPHGLIPLPAGIKLPKDSARPEDILRAFLHVPYRIDGAIDANGRYTYFAKQQTFATSPGLNCSGFVVAASRFLLHKNLTLPDVQKDRLHDSGPDSVYGHDWDFGWDIIMNVSEGYKRTMLLPGHATIDPSLSTGHSPQGFPLERTSTWKELLPRFKQGYLYLVSWSQPDMLPGYPLSHYHVGLIHKDSKGAIWLYQTTRQGKAVNRRDLATQQGMQSFLQDFVHKKGKARYLTIIEVQLPDNK